MEKVDNKIDSEELFKMVDPSVRGVITYSQLLETLLQSPETKNYFKASESS